MARPTAISVILLGLSVWFGLQLVQKYLGWIGLAAVVLTAALAAATIWMLDHDRPRLAKAYGRPACRPFIDVVAKMSGRQAPVQAPAEGRDRDAIALHVASDFAEAGASLRRLVRGHDRVIDAILMHLRDRLAVRETNREAEEEDRPLGVVLLIGGEGVGKKYLATCLARHLFRKGIVVTLDLAEPDADHAGAMLSSLLTHPHAMILLENADRATGKSLDRLTRVLADGRGRDPASGAAVGLGNALIVMTATSVPTHVEFAPEGLGAACLERIAAVTPLELPLLAQFDVIASCRPLDAWTRAEVVALLMTRECRRHGFELGYVAPEHLSREVEAIDDAHGMALLPPRIARLLRVPLAKAAGAGVTHLDLN